MDTSPTGAGKNDSRHPGNQSGRVQPHCRARTQKLQGSRTCLWSRRHQCGILSSIDPKKHAETTNKPPMQWSVGCLFRAPICPTCPHQMDCDYQDRMRHAESTKHSIATHSRAALSFQQIAAGMKYITIHEDPVSRAPAVHGDTFAAWPTNGRGNCPQCWQWIGGTWIRGNFFCRMEQIAILLADRLDLIGGTQSLEMPLPITKPPTVDADLYRAIKNMGRYA